VEQVRRREDALELIYRITRQVLDDHRQPHSMLRVARAPSTVSGAMYADVSMVLIDRDVSIRVCLTAFDSYDSLALRIAQQLGFMPE
jgi:hypothetical protein